MNRDEYRKRGESNIIHSKAGCYYPVDKQSGGTWFGFNQYGIVMSLLNRYQDKNKDAKKSRGIIIPQLLINKNKHQIIQSLNLMDMNDFNPFDLVIATTNHTIKHSWDRHQLSHIELPNQQPYILSSTSVDAETILPHRQKLFQDYLGKYPLIKSNHVLSHLHLAQDATDTSSSIFMSREETHTKSISQVLIERNTLSYNYLAEQHLIEIDNKQANQNSQALQINLHLNKPNYSNT